LNKNFLENKCFLVFMLFLIYYMADDPKTVKLLHDISKKRYESEDARRIESDNKARIIMGFVGFIIGVALLWGAGQFLDGGVKKDFNIPFIPLFVLPFIFFFVSIKNAFDSLKPQKYQVIDPVESINKYSDKDYISALKYVTTDYAECSIHNMKINMFKIAKIEDAFFYFPIGLFLYLIFIFLFLYFNI